MTKTINCAPMEELEKRIEELESIIKNISFFAIDIYGTWEKSIFEPYF